MCSVRVRVRGYVLAASVAGSWLLSGYSVLRPTNRNLKKEESLQRRKKVLRLVLALIRAYVTRAVNQTCERTNNEIVFLYAVGRGFVGVCVASVAV